MAAVAPVLKKQAYGTHEALCCAECRGRWSQRRRLGARVRRASWLQWRARDPDSGLMCGVHRGCSGSSAKETGVWDT